MKSMMHSIFTVFMLVAVTWLPISGWSDTGSVVTNDLSLWNSGTPKSAIVEFVKSVTDESSPHYLSPSARVAVFDMDGTILAEKPMYALFDFAIRKLQADIEKNPGLKEKQPHKAISEGDWDHFDSDWYADTGLYGVLFYATDDYSAAQYRHVQASGGKTFAASSLSAAVVTLIAALEETEEARDIEQMRLDQIERLSCRLPSGGVGGFI